MSGELDCEATDKGSPWTASGNKQLRNRLESQKEDFSDVGTWNPYDIVSQTSTKRKELQERRQRFQMRWQRPQYIHLPSRASSAESSEISPSSFEGDIEQSLYRAELSAHYVLRKLSDSATSKENCRRLVLIVETLPIMLDERVELCDALKSYIEKYRDSENSEDLVAVGAAIRKFVLNLSTDDLASVASLLEAGHRASVPLEIELEIAKATVWHLKSNPPAGENQFPELANRLFELAATYSNNRLLPREKYAATALNAVLALLLLRSHVEETLERLKSVRLTWFTELVASRCRRLRYDLLQSSTSDEVTELAADLERFANALSSQS